MKLKILFFFMATFLLWLTLAIVRWGQPFPWQVILADRIDRNQDGNVDCWRLKDTKSGETIIENDTNSDGRVDQIQWGNPHGRVVDLSDTATSDTRRKKLIVCLDGVPYEDMAYLWDHGYFREFSRPGKLISVFPSLSDVAITNVLHTAPVPGYENLYFDVAKNKIGGGAFSTVSKIRMPYLDALDYDEPGIFKGLAYILPLKTYHADLGRFSKRLADKEFLTFKSHICSTDAICHVLTREAFLNYMVETDRMLREIFVRYHGNLDFLVFSDHGNSHVTNHRVDLDGYLAQFGFRIESSIRDEWSVAIPKFGLVGAMPVYSQSQNTKRLSQVLADSEAVDFVAYLDDGKVRLLSSKGEALIRATGEGNRLRYEVLKGDPLDLKPIVEQMTQRGVIESDGYASRENWFSYTAEHEYADALNALYSGVTNHVTNRASLIVSFKDGYHYGSPFFNRLVTMRSTHGNLRKSSMTGFYMRNGPMPQKVMAARDLLREEIVQ